MREHKITVNGEPLTLWQKIIGSIVSIAILVAGFFLSAFFFMIALVVGVIGFIVFWWKTRQIRSAIKEQTERMNSEMGATQFDQEFSSQEFRSSTKQKGKTLEGEYKEL